MADDPYKNPFQNTQVPKVEAPWWQKAAGSLGWLPTAYGNPLGSLMLGAIPKDPINKLSDLPKAVFDPQGYRENLRNKYIAGMKLPPEMDEGIIRAQLTGDPSGWQQRVRPIISRERAAGASSATAARRSEDDVDRQTQRTIGLMDHEFKLRASQSELEKKIQERIQEGINKNNLDLAGLNANTSLGVANINANANLGVANIGANAQRDVANIGLQGTLAQVEGQRYATDKTFDLGMQQDRTARTRDLLNTYISNRRGLEGFMGLAMQRRSFQ